MIITELKCHSNFRNDNSESNIISHLSVAMSSDHNNAWRRNRLDEAGRGLGLEKRDSKCYKIFVYHVINSLTVIPKGHTPW